jgi:predicted RNA-binding protein Jag
VTIAFNTEINNNGQTAIDSVQQYLSNLLDQIGIDLQLTATQSHSQQQIMPLPQQSEEASVRQSNVVYFPLRKINR